MNSDDLSGQKGTRLRVSNVGEGQFDLDRPILSQLSLEPSA